MGCWDAPCIICGAPPNRQGEMYSSEENIVVEMPKEYYDLTKWLLNCTLLLPDGQIVHNYIETACNTEFESKDGKGKSIIGQPEINEIDLSTGELTPFGMWLHDDCWKYIKNYLGINLSYNYLPEHQWTIYGFIDGVKYGGIEGYQSQDFEFYEMFQNKDQYMVISPLGKSKDAAKNRTRLNKILSQLKLTKSEVKKRKNRPSPPISATLVKSNAFSIGNDGKVWKKVAGKWAKAMPKGKEFTKLEVELDYTNKVDPKGKRLINRNIFMREQTSYEKNPVFIMKYDLKKDGPYKVVKGSYEFSSTMDGYKNLFKYFKKYNLEYKVKEY